MLMTLLFVGACQKNETPEAAVAEEVDVTLSVAIPGTLSTKAVETEAVSAGAETDIVYYEIWDAAKTKKLYPKAGEGLKSEVVENNTAEITVSLVTDQTYTFIFWAQNANCGAYDVTDLTSVEIDYDVIKKKGNDDVFDAFYTVKQIEIKKSANYDPVILRRPFSQLNFGASVMSTDLGPIVVDSTYVTVSQLSKVFKTFEGVGDVNSVVEDVKFAAKGLVSATEGENAQILKTNGKEYTWLSMDYMLMTEASATVDVNAMFRVYGIGDVKHEIPGVSIKKNYRTNIVGDLFTTDAKLTIIIDPDFVLNEEGEFDDIIKEY